MQLIVQPSSAKARAAGSARACRPRIGNAFEKSAPRRYDSRSGLFGRGAMAVLIWLVVIDGVMMTTLGPKSGVSDDRRGCARTARPPTSRKAAVPAIGILRSVLWQILVQYPFFNILNIEWILLSYISFLRAALDRFASHFLPVSIAC
jgi:hypothetical protein